MFSRLMYQKLETAVETTNYQDVTYYKNPQELVSLHSYMAHMPYIHSDDISMCSWNEQSGQGRDQIKVCCPPAFTAR